MSKRIKHFYDFGLYRIDVGDRFLYRAGELVPLSPKLFDTLLVLVEHSGRVLEKDELMQLVWPETAVEESNLTQNISQLRKLLGEGNPEARLIETIPRRGYRFVAEVTEVREGGDLDPWTSKSSLASVSLASGGVVVPIPVKDRSRQLAAQPVLQLVESPAVLPSPGIDSIETSPIDQVEVESQVAEVSVDPLAARTEISRRAIGSFIAMVMVTVLGGVWWIYRQQAVEKSDPDSRPVEVVRLTSNGQVQFSAISPDGRYLTYSIDDHGLQSLWVQNVASPQSIVIVPPAKVRYVGLTFSTDGNFVYYTQHKVPEEVTEHSWLPISSAQTDQGALFEIPVLGGTPRLIVDRISSRVGFSPDGRHMAFIRSQPESKATSIVIAQADGQNARSVLTRQENEFVSYAAPAWSPDGTSLAFVVGGYEATGFFTQLMVMNIKTGETQDATLREWGNVEQAVWNQDGQSLLFTGTARHSSQSDQLWQLSWPEKKLRQITTDFSIYQSLSLATQTPALVMTQTSRVCTLSLYASSDLNQSERQLFSGFMPPVSEHIGLSWTPDGKILYGSHQSGNFDIWKMNSDGTGPVQLTANPAHDLEPVMSRDGHWIVFQSKRSGPSNIWRMEASGSNLQQLTHGNGEYAPNFSPDSRWVVYFTFLNGKPAIGKVSVDGGDPVFLAVGKATRPVISPDGKWIACYYRESLDQPLRLAILDFEQGAPVKIFQDVSLPDPAKIQWSADSKSLFFGRTERGMTNLWKLPIEGSLPQPVTKFKNEMIYRFSWSPDEKWLALERGTTISDVVLMRNFSINKGF